jgi:hypothetical protein
VLDKTLYSLHNDLKKDPWRHSLDLYSSAGFDVQYPVNQPMNCLSPPALVRMGQDLFIDKDTHPHVWGFICEWMIRTSTNYRVNICQTNGHADGVFCPVAPGIIVSSHYKSDYSQSFPGWEVFKIPLKELGKRGHTRWRTSSTTINQNKTFSDYILKNANDWVGNFEETVYEVNMLVIDEHNVIAMKEYPPLTEWLFKRGINVHYFDLRTRTFWDGGWHCFTLDINRDDSKTNLFSSDNQTGVQWKLN